VLSDYGKPFLVSAPTLAYDPAAARFLMAAVASDRASQLSLITLAVSETDDPRGDWCLYTVDPALTGDERQPLMAGEVTLGFNRDAIYLTADLYEAVDGGPHSALSFDHARAFFLGKSVYYRPGCAGGERLGWYRIGNLHDADGRPARGIRAVPNLDGTGEAYLVGTDRQGAAAVTLWRALTRAGDIPLDRRLEIRGIDVDPYSAAPAAPQPGTDERLDAGDASPASAVQVGGEVWLAHTVRCGAEGPCTQWYRLDPDGSALIRSERRPLADANAYCPVLMPDGHGEPVLVQNYSSAEYYASLRVGDGFGHDYVFETGSVGRGGACYDDERGAGPSLWGSHNAIALDPATGTVWAHAAVADGTSDDCAANGWRTVLVAIDRPRQPPSPTPIPPTQTPPAGRAICLPLAFNWP
jgi:hypothetical protein